VKFIIDVDLMMRFYTWCINRGGLIFFQS